ncbi:class I SAM-dependent methyltransferase [Marinicauda sp. Alg238-R41]|jgi:SAM-dependent methyltransferase|uniref:class I SAM-dependent methyltransferase n=1 Tax=Marinicauda sp. Alg238-R41 TaxID=2993447 RepID=UPI0022E8C411|nr:class I SAM-dependent methyltransferase [Marinicauda sp. Alg238-R41]
MSETEAAARTWDGYYAGSFTHAPYTDAVVFAIKALSRNRAGMVYEFGCGNAQNLGFLRSLFPDARLIGSDVSEAGLAAARRRYEGLELFANGETLALAPASLDVVIERAALQHVPKPLGQAYVDEIAEAMKPGAGAFFEIANTDHGHAALGDGGQDPVFGYRVFYSLGEIETLFAAFDIDQVFERRRTLVRAPDPAGSAPVYNEACFQIYLTRR